MKNISIVISIIICLRTEDVYSQNLVSNGSFENCKPNVVCSPQGLEGQFNRVLDWSGFGTDAHFGDPFGFSTPDWYVDNNAPDGDYVAGIFENEGIFYDFGSGGLKTSIYHLSFDAKGADENTTLGATPAHGVSCFLSTVPPSQLNCTNFAGGDVYLLDKRTLSTSGSWTHIEFDFPAYNGIVPYRYLVFGSYRNGVCDRYVFLDNVVVEEDCCGEFMKYQHCDYLPKYTSRQDFIKAGYDVGCVWQPVGNVTVKNGQDITFQSGNYVSIEPGFNIEPGGVYTARIAECGDVPANALNDTNLLFYSNAAFFTCDGGPNNAIFTSTGFSYYRVRIFNAWGEKVYDMIGHINEIFTLYTSGADISTDISQGLFTVQLELFNCSYSKLEAFSLFYEYVDPCVSAYFKNDTHNLVDTPDYSDENNGDVMLYPNPASDLVNLCYSVDNNQNVHFIISDQLGSIVYEKENIPVMNKNQMHVIHTNNLSNGSYYLTLYKGGKRSIRKFIIQR